MKCLPFILLSCLLVDATFAAAAPPGTDIWLAELDVQDDRLRVAGARNLTRRPGYDNQPFFVTNDALLFTSMDGTGQTDAWRFDLASGKAEPLLVTPESEYSPTPAPGGALSVVRVSLQNVQQLWMLPPGASRYDVLFPMLEGVGYHAWLDEDHVALFMIPGEEAPMELHVANRKTGSVVVMAKDIGRSLQIPPASQGNVAFVENGHDGRRWIKCLDFHDKRVVPMAPVVERSEDFAFLPDGRLLMARERTVFVREGDRWEILETFNDVPGAITRLAVSPNGRRLAFVAEEDE